MAGINFAETGHLVNCIPPIDIDTAGATTGVTINMGTYSHVTFICTTGVTDAVPGTITLQEVATVAGVGVAIPFTYYMEDTALGDVLSARNIIAGVGGVALSANDNTIYVFEVDASQLTNGFPYIEFNWSNPGGSTFGSVVAVLSGARYSQPESPSVRT
jgi:hypothetical protein